MLRLRGYRPEDLDALYAIDIACFPEPFRFSRAALARFVQASRAQSIVAEDASVLAGFLIVHLEREEALHGYVVTLDVLHPYRRSGLGSRLLLEGERLASTAGAAGMRLHVYAGNTGAQSFYQRMGYKQTGTVTHFYGRSLHALRLEKSLTSQRHSSLAE